MTRDAAFNRAYSEQLIAYLLAGIAFTLIQVFDSKFRDKYQNKGFVVFLIKISKGIIPLSLLSILLGNSSSNFGEAVMVWLVAVIAIYIFVSPFYLLYWLYKKLLKKHED